MDFEIECPVLVNLGGGGLTPEVEVGFVREDSDDAALVVVAEGNERVGGALDEIEKAARVIGGVADGVFGVCTETFESKGGVEG